MPAKTLPRLTESQMACARKVVARARMAVVMADTTGAIAATGGGVNEHPPVCNANVRNARMASVIRLQA